MWRAHEILFIKGLYSQETPDNVGWMREGRRDGCIQASSRRRTEVSSIYYQTGPLSLASSDDTISCLPSLPSLWSLISTPSLSPCSTENILHLYKSQQSHWTPIYPISQVWLSVSPNWDLKESEDDFTSWWVGCLPWSSQLIPGVWKTVSCDV